MASAPVSMGCASAAPPDSPSSDGNSAHAANAADPTRSKTLRICAFILAPAMLVLMRKLSFLVAIFLVVACGGLVSGSDGGAGSDAGGASDAAHASVLKASGYVTSCNASTDC